MIEDRVGPRHTCEISPVKVLAVIGVFRAIVGSVFLLAEPPPPPPGSVATPAAPAVVSTMRLPRRLQPSRCRSAERSCRARSVEEACRSRCRREAVHPETSSATSTRPWTTCRATIRDAREPRASPAGTQGIGTMKHSSSPVTTACYAPTSARWRRRSATSSRCTPVLSALPAGLHRPDSRTAISTTARSR